MGRTKGGLNTKLQAVTNAKGRPLTFFLTAGQASDYAATTALLNSLPAAEWMIADRSNDADLSRDALKDKGIHPCIPVGRRAAKPSATTNDDPDAATGSRSCLADGRNGDASRPVTAGAPKPSFQ